MEFVHKKRDADDAVIEMIREIEICLTLMREWL